MEKTKKLVAKKDADYLAIDLNPKNLSIWEKAKNRFTTRVFSIFNNIKNWKLTKKTTVSQETGYAFENLIASSQAILQKPRLTNIEKQASIKLKLAEVKKLEAEARLINAQADEKNIAIEQAKQIRESQEKISILIKRGELIPIQKDGQLIFIYEPKI